MAAWGDRCCRLLLLGATPNKLAAPKAHLCVVILPQPDPGPARGTFTRLHQASSSAVLVVIVEVDAQQEVLQVGLVASVHQLGHHYGRSSEGVGGALPALLPRCLWAAHLPVAGGGSPLKRKWE